MAEDWQQAGYLQRDRVEVLPVASVVTASLTGKACRILDVALARINRLLGIRA
jgi:hypothetical protein